MKLINKGEILSDGVDDIYDIIFREYTHKGFCDVDFEGVKFITTKFAGKLFGRLYDNLGKVMSRLNVISYHALTFFVSKLDNAVAQTGAGTGGYLHQCHLSLR